MIVDTLDHILNYKALLPGIENGIAAVKQLTSYEVGRYEFKGGFFFIQKGETTPLKEGTYEAHRKYIDVQIIVEGSEEMAWEEISKLTTAIAYDPQKDAERLDGDFEHVIKITENMFYAAFPHDAHKPCSHSAVRQSYTKVVMKLPV